MSSTVRERKRGRRLIVVAADPAPPPPLCCLLYMPAPYDVLTMTLASAEEGVRERAAAAAGRRQREHFGGDASVAVC